MRESGENNASLQSRSKDKKTKADSMKESGRYLCSEGGREEHGRIHIPTKKIVKYKGVGAS